MSQTAVEYIEKGIKVRERHWHDQYQQGYQRALSDMMLLVDDAKEMEKEQLNQARIDGIMLANKGYGKSCEYSGLPPVESYEDKQ